VARGRLIQNTYLCSSAMIFDTIIMVACLWGLWTSKPRSGERASELYNLLWTDGLLYFICASVANAFPGELIFERLSIAHSLDSVTFMGLALNRTYRKTWPVILLIPLSFSRDGHRFDGPLRVRCDNCFVSCCASAQFMGHKQPIVSRTVIL
jgi:hypothetical protein